jgi:septal ring factor EnvC (AmiA/AmiB activator)
VFVISLILNIFMAGILLGRYFFQPPGGFHPSSMMMRPPHPRHFAWMLKQLPEETRKKVEPIVQQQFQREQMHAEMRQIHKSFHDMEALFVAEPLDKVAIQQQFEALQDRKNQMAKRLNEGLLRIADQLNQVERQQLIQAIRHSKPFRDKPPHHQRHGEFGKFDGMAD